MATVSGGERLEAYLKELAQKVSNPGTLRVGFFSRATYPDGTSVPMVAAIQNYGAPSRGIPPRPFFTNFVSKGKKTWGKALTTILQQNDYDATRSLQLMGEGMRGELQASITEGSYAPLKPATVRRKGFDTPLIDTSNMLNSVESEVT